MTSDPIGFHGGLNTFAYSGGNPLRNLDVRGLSFSDELWMTFDWFFGYGPDNRVFSEFSDQVKELKRTPAIQAARNLFYSKMLLNVTVRARNLLPNIRAALDYLGTVRHGGI